MQRNTQCLKTLVYLIIMEVINVIIIISLIISVNSHVLSYDDEDHILDMLLNNNYISNELTESKEVSKDGEKPLFVNGSWLCGNCSDISEINLLYNESYDIETTYDEEMELQIGFSLDNTRCIQISTDEDAKVEIVSGACAGDAVTLKVMDTNNFDVWIYS